MLVTATASRFFYAALGSLQSGSALYRTRSQAANWDYTRTNEGYSTLIATRKSDPSLAARLVLSAQQDGKGRDSGGVQRHRGRPIARRISHILYRDEVERTATAISGRSRPKLITSYASCPHKTLPIGGTHPFGRLELPIRRPTPAWAEPNRF